MIKYGKEQWDTIVEQSICNVRVEVPHLKMRTNQRPVEEAVSHRDNGQQNGIPRGSNPSDAARAPSKLCSHSLNIRAEGRNLDLGIKGRAAIVFGASRGLGRSEEHTSELQSLMRISYAVFCLKKKKKIKKKINHYLTNIVSQNMRNR